MSTIIMIPARMGSTRLPEKPLVDINGEPMVKHVWQRAIAANAGDVVVACDNERVAEVISSAGGQAIMTDPNLPSGSDRIWAALQRIDQCGKYDQVINLQGDQPFFDPQLLRDVLLPLKDSSYDIGTLAITAPVNIDNNPNSVKIAAALTSTNRLGTALYFSRATIPAGEGATLHHIGIYSYTRDSLEKFVNLPPSPLEEREKLEQLRALEARMKIGVYLVDNKPFSVDTMEDLEKARQMSAR